jgi:acetylserotonin N-methyltransferase
MTSSPSLEAIRSVFRRRRHARKRICASAAVTTRQFEIGLQIGFNKIKLRRRTNLDGVIAIDSAHPDPSIVLELAMAFRRSKTMFAAISLGVFDALSEGSKSTSALAAKLRASPDALGRLLDACVGLGLLACSQGQYSNTPAAAAYLCRSSPRRLTGYNIYSNEVLWNLWAHLEDAVREGGHRWKQAYGWDGPIFANFFHTEEAKHEFLMGMHGYGLISSPHVVAAIDLSPFRRMVDLGGATGHLAIAACQRYPRLHAVVFDLPEAVPLARKVVADSPVADRVAVQPGDFFKDPLPPADLYALGRIVHDWAEEKIDRLLRKIYEQLPAGGALLIAEKMLEEERGGPTWALMQSLNMLVCAEGKERTLAEYEVLLKKAGFSEVQGCRTSSPLDAILATKR